MNQWGGGQRFGGGGFGGGFGGYGNGGYMPQSFNHKGYGQPQGFGWNNNFSNGLAGWNQFGGWPQFNGFQSAAGSPQYQLPGPKPLGSPSCLQPGHAGHGSKANSRSFSCNSGHESGHGSNAHAGMVRLPPINYDQYQKQPNQYEYLNGGNSPFSQVA